MPHVSLDCPERFTFSINATLIGDFHLGGPTAARASSLGRKSRALLAYLMLASARRAPRERLATLLWGDRGDDQARGSLRQALHEVRALTDDTSSPFQISRHEVVLSPDRILTDVDAIRAAGKEGNARALAQLLGPYPGVLLSDLDDISPTFDEWLRIERARWRHEWRTCALSAARTAQAEGMADVAERLSSALVADDPLDESTAVLAMEIAHARGDRAAIRRAFHLLEEALRQDLDTSPGSAAIAARDRLLAAPARDQGMAVPLVFNRSALFAQMQRPPEALIRTADEPHTESTIPHVPKRRPRWYFTAIIFAMVLVVCVVGVLRWHFDGTRRESIFIEPLRIEAKDTAAQVLSAGLSAGLSRVLVGTGTDIDILDPSDTATHATKPSLVLSGNAVTSNGRMYVTIHLSGGSPATMIWSRDFSRPTSEVDPLSRQIALCIGRELYFAFGKGRDRFLSSDPELMRIYLAGYDWVGKDFEEASRYFSQVTTRRPDFAQGWSAYAASAALAALALPDGARTTANTAAIHAARRALAIDPHQGLAYYAMATTEDSTSNWLKRDAIVQQGLNADPLQPELNAMRGDNLMAIGRFHDAVGYFRKAYAADHFLPGKPFELANALAETGDLDGAQELIQQGYDLWPDIPWFKYLDSKIAYHWGNVEKARALLNDPGSSNTPSHLSTMTAFLQWRANPAVDTNFAAVTAIDAELHETGATPELVQELAVLGHIDQAYRAAASLTSIRGKHENWFHDYLAPFRDDRRFVGLMARLGLAAIWQKTDQWPDYCSDEKLSYNCKFEASRIVLHQ